MRWLAGMFALILLAQPAHAQRWQPSDGDVLVFDVLRDGGAFGTHKVSFQKTGDALTVKTSVDLRVAVGPFTLFEYLHDVTERYSAGKLTWIGSRTKNEGKWKTLSAKAVEGGLQVTGEAFKGLLAGAVIPSTHWNAEQMRQRAMLSTETGEMLPITVKDRGFERVKTAKGTIDARRFDVDSELDASFWYDAQGRWVKCAFETQGSKIEYVLRGSPG